MTRRLRFVLVLLAIALAACGTGAANRSESDSPADVVRAYVKALDAHDIATAKTMLSADHERDVASQEDSWFKNVKSIDDLKILQTRPGASGQYKFVVEVPVTFDLVQVNETSMLNGNTLWGYQLGRDSEDEPWEIFGEGAA